MLPIVAVRDSILSALLDRGSVILSAPTGSGKSTQVPQWLIDENLAGGGEVLVLQPRRVAARALARRVSEERKQPLGKEVGYQVRFDDRTSEATRILFMTEGVFLRRLQENPTLKGIGAVVFDEFHERNLLSDVALALTRKLRRESRPDLKLLVMSATLSTERVARYLDNATVVKSEGSLHPVEIRYLPHLTRAPAPELAVEAVQGYLSGGGEGHILVFMPGMAEIQATLRGLEAVRGNGPLVFFPLHGDLTPEAQDRAFIASEAQKIIVATNVAETSITIDGIRCVVDSGLARVARYDAERGLQTLNLEDISRASTDQRKGRAGRTGPGVCYRLWTESGQLNRPAHGDAEILRADLAEVVLLLHSLGVTDAVEFDWLEGPGHDAVRGAEKLLHDLGALKPAPRGGLELTPVGRAMLRLPMHPRYSRMLVEADRLSCLPAACTCAALVSGRDLLTRISHEDSRTREAREVFEGSAQSDFFTLFRAFEFARQCNFNADRCRSNGIHGANARFAAETLDQLLNQAERQFGKDALERKPAGSPDDALAKCLLAGFADQLCVRKDSGSLECLLAGGRTAVLERETVVRSSRLLVVARLREVDMRSYGLKPLAGLATAVKEEWIAELFPSEITRRVDHKYDPAHKRVVAQRVVVFRGLELSFDFKAELNPAACGKTLARAFTTGGAFQLPLMNHEVRQWIARFNLIALAAPELELKPFELADLEAFLSGAFHGISLAREAQEVTLIKPFKDWLGKDRLALINELAPSEMKLENGAKFKLVYQEPERGKMEKVESPHAQIKMQDILREAKHPAICEGRIPVSIMLHAPDGKKLGATTDWPSFKLKEYPKLKPELTRKYTSISWV